jgi:DNA polymerase-1
MKHNLIVDGSNLIMTSLAVNVDDYLSDGRYMGGVSGFLRSLSKLNDRLQPEQIFVTFDYDKSEYRLKLHPEYKSGRSVSDPDLKFRFSHRNEHQDILLDILPNLNIYPLVAPKVEADDIVSNFVKKSRNYNTIVSTDKDFLQLINETTSVYRPVSNEFIDHTTIDDYLGYPVKWHALIKILQGDKSDNIEGVKWLGDKTSTKLFKNIGTDPDKLYVHANDIIATRKKVPKRDWATNLINFIDDGKWELNQKLMDLDYGPEVDIKSLLLPVTYNREIVESYLTDLGFNDIMKYNEYDYIFSPLEGLNG